MKIVKSLLLIGLAICLSGSRCASTPIVEHCLLLASPSAACVDLRLDKDDQQYVLDYNDMVQGGYICRNPDDERLIWEELAKKGKK